MQHIAGTDRLQRHLAEAGLQVTVAEWDGALRLSGVVNSDETRRAVEDLAAGIAPDAYIQNDLAVDATLPTPPRMPRALEPVAEPTGSPRIETLAAEVEADFSTLPPELNDAEIMERGDAVFAPVDPVVAIGAHGQAEVLGGFSSDALAEVAVDASAEDALPGDEALAEAIGRELREDAATTNLPIDVFVRRGVAHLRGWVPDVEDADNAEAVALRVPGVRDVVDELELPRL